MKKIFLSILAVILMAALSVPALAAGFANFTSSGDYLPGRFGDVSESDWFAQYVESAYNFGLIRGRDGGVFDPQGMLSLGEALTLAVRLRSVYHAGCAEFAESAPFYSVYAEYALRHNIIGARYDFSVPATRAQFAQFIYNALPLEALGAINRVDNIPDVVPGSSFSDAVFTLYRAGVLRGSDRYGTFFPEAPLTRAEAAAIMSRLANPAVRINFTLTARMSAEVIYQRSRDAVFMLETFDSRGEYIRTGSGFFICETGLAVTILHTLDFASNAIVTLSSGLSYPVRGLYAFCHERNLAIIGIDFDYAAWPYLTLADSDAVAAGDPVYALGSPHALQGTITKGIVSSVGREVGGQSFIQFTAPISFGSGGGPLLNGLGQVVGVASISFPSGQNLNMAVPSNLIGELEFEEYMLTLLFEPTHDIPTP